MNKIKVAIIGECMVELKEIDDVIYQSFGGDTLNTAIYLSRLTPKITVSYLTGVGKDHFTTKMLSQWQSAGICIDYVRHSINKQNGIYSIQTRDNGEHFFNYWRNDSAAKYWVQKEDIDHLIAELCSFDLIYLSGISLAILTTESRNKLFSALSVCQLKGIKIAFDNNYRPTLWDDDIETRNVYSAMLKLTDIAFLTFDDERKLWGDTTKQQAIERTQGFGVNEIIVRQGKHDCFVVADNAMYAIPAQRVSKVIDTTAAGDAFSAGYLAKRLTGGEYEQCAAMGHLLASKVIQHHGAIIPETEMPIMHNAMTELVNQLANYQVVPIAVVDDPKKAVKVAQILIENELPCIEVAFRSNKTPNIIKQLRDTYPQMLIGAGSITKIEQVDLAIEAGANFLVSPSINPNVVHYCQEKGIDLIVSINSPYLIEKAMEVGVMTMKFFPAEASGGAPMLKAISAVYPDVKFIPSGGINPFNLVNYLSISNVACVSGTWLIPPALIEAEEWQQIAEFIEDELRFVRE